MNIDWDLFLQWAEARLGEIHIQGDEIRANSIFHPTHGDTKFRLWMKPSGGTRKGDRSDGVYHCFDTDQRGTLVGLVMHVDKCSYTEARNLVCQSTHNLAKLEKQVNAILANAKLDINALSDKEQLSLPPNTLLTNKTNDYRVSQACVYLEQRKLPIDKFMLCVGEGKYKNRLVIPYYDRSGQLIYFNTRALHKSNVKYLGPSLESGVGKEDVIYADVWPDNGSTIYLTEGEFDAKTLNICGFYGMACGGKTISDKQIDLLKSYKVCLALDNDISGKAALLKMFNKFRSNGITNLSYVVPPAKVKDWNDLLVESDAEVMKAYITENEKPLTESEFVGLSFGFFKC